MAAWPRRERRRNSSHAGQRHSCDGGSEVRQTCAGTRIIRRQMINRLVLLPGMHGTGELFSEFMRRMPEPKHIEAPSYPTGSSPSYDQLQAMVESIVPPSEDFVLLAESFSAPLAIQYAESAQSERFGPLRGLCNFAAPRVAKIVCMVDCNYSFSAPFAGDCDLPFSYRTGCVGITLHRCENGNPLGQTESPYSTTAPSPRGRCADRAQENLCTRSFHTSPARPTGWTVLPRRDCAQQPTDQNRAH